MLKNNFILLLLCSFLLVSCEFQCSVGGDKNKSGKGKTVTSSLKDENGALISNGINIKTNGVKLKSAILELANGERVSDDNMVNLNEKIYLALKLDSTWTVIDNKSFIGASEKMTTSKGNTVLNAADLFSAYDETGVNPVDAKEIRLNAVVTSQSNDIKYYQVDFRVWDKKGTAEITGDYKFSIKK